VSSIMVANRGAADTRFRIAVRPDGATISDEHYVAYDVLLEANSLFALSVGITLNENDVVSVYADDATLSFNVFGSEVA